MLSVPGIPSKNLRLKDTDMGTVGYWMFDHSDQVFISGADDWKLIQHLSDVTYWGRHTLWKLSHRVFAGKTPESP